MLALLKSKNSYETAARGLYAQILEKTRQPVFYRRFSVPDTFSGRFDLLLLHIFVVINRVANEGRAGKDLGQALFDATFADMDQTLREMGIGDMGVPKHMRRMMKAFNGRVHAYSAALEDTEKLEQALRRNLYGTLSDVSDKPLRGMADYLRSCITVLDRLPLDDILETRIVWPDIAEG